MEHGTNGNDGSAISTARDETDEAAERREETTQGVTRRRDESAPRGASARWIRRRGRAHAHGVCRAHWTRVDRCV